VPVHSTSGIAADDSRARRSHKYCIGQIARDMEMLRDRDRTVARRANSPTTGLRC